MSRKFEDLNASFRGMIETLEHARVQVRGGIILDLRDLDAEAKQLCADVENADKKIAQDLKPVMAEMITTLEALEADLRAFCDKHRQEAG